jgi:hypothetical protein
MRIGSLDPRLEYNKQNIGRAWYTGTGPVPVGWAHHMGIWRKIPGGGPPPGYPIFRQSRGPSPCAPNENHRPHDGWILAPPSKLSAAASTRSGVMLVMQAKSSGQSRRKQGLHGT